MRAILSIRLAVEGLCGVMLGWSGVHTFLLIFDSRNDRSELSLLLISMFVLATAGLLLWDAFRMSKRLKILDAETWLE